MSGRYDDIIHLPHHQSVKHPRMTMTERAAQFSPFAALTGYGAVIAETGRLTDSRIELTDEQKDEIDRRLNELLQSGEPASFTYFIPDGKKDGGRVVTVTGSVRRLDPIEGIIVFESGEKIPVREILGIGEGSGAEGTE
ncbi:MAG: hypothetical protein IKQ92_11360 [Clostridia bacterium]|nr:hypothetical protein [Clostridia bacterium]